MVGSITVIVITIITIIDHGRSGSVGLATTLLSICLGLVLGLLIGLATLAVSDGSSRGLRMLLDGEVCDWLPTLAGVATFLSHMVLLGSASHCSLFALAIALCARRWSLGVGVKLYLLSGLWVAIIIKLCIGRSALDA
jgi:hypothetical protein